MFRHLWSIQAVVHSFSICLFNSIKGVRDNYSKGDEDLTASWSRGLTIRSFLFIQEKRKGFWQISCTYGFPPVFVPTGNKKKRRQGNSTIDAPPSDLKYVDSVNTVPWATQLIVKQKTIKYFTSILKSLKYKVWLLYTGISSFMTFKCFTTTGTNSANYFLGKLMFIFYEQNFPLKLSCLAFCTLKLSCLAFCYI